ncbi:hypothetical protein FE784_00150 [Paenibacillus hemerocallicola]|uniref:Cobalamin biosynthesis protein CbiN n=1 Tax=Paenibacillus hemerocallicola TaxID=1172614 RepID=A0A5C4TG93_9BACL|nr:hypothetical protein [Paenibacillus hemerocallicola]TNJ68113.1 hypothetical protein FE784_00150 [Paenibacillus hemerocallicola]
MNRYVSAILLCVLVFTAVVSIPEGEVYACSCGGEDAKERLELFMVVFEGKVLNRGELKEFQQQLFREYTFEINRAWKGIEKERITIFTYGEASSCYFKFTENETYLVYAYPGKDHEWETNFCSGNIPISKAKEELKQLGSGTEIYINDGAADARNYSRNVLISSVVIFILALGVLASRRVRKRKD